MIYTLCKKLHWYYYLLTDFVVITILNNIRREAIIASIVDSIGKNDKLTKVRLKVEKELLSLKRF